MAKKTKSKKNKSRIVIRLVNKETGSVYYTTKSKRNTTDRVVLNKFDKKLVTQTEDGTPKIGGIGKFEEAKGKNLGRNEVKARKH